MSFCDFLKDGKYSTKALKKIQTRCMTLRKNWFRSLKDRWEPVLNATFLTVCLLQSSVIGKYICNASLICRFRINSPFSVPGKGTVTLTGDAFHPMTPNLGQGAALCLEVIERLQFLFKDVL